MKLSSDFNLMRYLWFFVCLLSTATANSQVIQTFAGGAANDGRSATQIALAIPLGAAVDASGNIYIAEALMNRVRRVSATSGIVTTVAGTGTAGFSGDGGPAAASTLSTPSAVAFDRAGNLYIVDSDNRRIRRVDAASQIITTFAGGGIPGVLGEGGPATAAGITPVAIALDASDNLFISDPVSNRVRRVDAATRVITTVAGTDRGFAGDGGPATAAKFDSIRGLDFDSAGNLFIADMINERVRRIDAATRIISTVAGTGAIGYSGDGGPATAAMLALPQSVAVDGAGNLYIADADNARIRKVDATTHTISTVAGTGTGGFSGDGGPASAAVVSYSTSVTLDASGNLYITDTGNLRIRRIDRTTNVINTVTGGAGDNVPATAAVLLGPRDVALDAAGNVYIADQSNHRIRRVDAVTHVLTTVAGTGTGGFSGDGGPATAAKLYSPFGVVLDARNNIYIADDDNYRVRRVDGATGTITTLAGNGTNGFSGDGGPAIAASLGEVAAVAVDASGNVYIADPGNARVRKVDTAGVITTYAGGGTTVGDGGPATSAIVFASALTTDAAGNLYIAESGPGLIRKVDAVTKIITTVAGGGPFNATGEGLLATGASLRRPNGIAVDSAGNLYISESNGNRVRKVSAATKTIVTIAGNGIAGFLGDGGAAIAAELNDPNGLKVDAAGTIYIADRGNNRIRVVAAIPARRRAVR
jgi:sugar lactone lactonase YvrE